MESMGIERGELEMAVVRLLHESWSPIGFKYDGLTPQERSHLSREHHGALVHLMSSLGLIEEKVHTEGQAFRLEPDGNAPIEVFPFVTAIHREVIIRHLDETSEDIELSPDEAAQLAGMIAMSATQARSMEIK